MDERGAEPPVVLVVDDDADHAFVLAALLEVDGFTVLVATSRAEARAILESRSVDVLLSDFLLGDGTAHDLALDLGEHRPRVAIVLSGFEGADAAARTAAIGFDAHLTKPVHLPLLRETIEAGLRRPSEIRVAGGVACADPRFRRASRE